MRQRVQTANGILPLRHQAEWQLASEGYVLQPYPPTEPTDQFVDCIMTVETLPPGSAVMRYLTVNNVASAVVRRCITPRPDGNAHVIADLAAYKAGKSYWAALWASGFACLPNVRVHIVGQEYSIAEPEFGYLLEFLLSERGMNMKADKLSDDRRGGRMFLKLRATGAEFEVKSWERKEGLKGKKIVAYLFAEAYQFPGLEVYTTLKQNLRELHGYALFPTTADRPWVSVFHEHGHGGDPDWHCSCGVDGRENPYTFDAKARARDDPAQGGIMTRERFAISWQGLLGSYIGRVYDYGKGDISRVFTPDSHPLLWNRKTLADLSQPA